MPAWSKMVALIFLPSVCILAEGFPWEFSGAQYHIARLRKRAGGPLNQAKQWCKKKKKKSPRTLETFTNLYHVGTTVLKNTFFSCGDVKSRAGISARELQMER